MAARKIGSTTELAVEGSGDVFLFVEGKPTGMKKKTILLCVCPKMVYERLRFTFKQRLGPFELLCCAIMLDKANNRDVSPLLLENTARNTASHK